MAIVDELITLLGLKIDPKAEGAASSFAKVIESVTGSALAAGAALTAFAGGIVAYAKSQAEAINEAGKFADSIGLSYESLQQLEYAVGKTGGSASALRSDLERLNKTMTSPIPGEYNQTLYMLGVSARDASGKVKTADAVLLDVADKLQGMSKQRQIQFADKLGISKDTLGLLQKGRGSVNDLKAEAVRLGLVLDESAKVKAARFQESLFGVKAIVNALGKTIAVALLPAMSDALDAFSKWVARNREFISAGITQVVTGVGKGFQMVGDMIAYAWKQVVKFLGPAGDMVKELDATQAIALTVVGALAAVAVSIIAATWPVIALVAAITAGVLVFEDLYAAINGQESIIGDWAKSFQQAYPGIAGVFEKILNLAIKVGEFLGNGLAASFKFGLDSLEKIAKTFLSLFQNFLGAIEDLIKGANPFAVLSDLFMKQVKLIIDLAKNLGTGIFDGIKAVFNIGGASASPVPASVMAGGSSQSNVTTNNINVNGAGNPGAVANEVMMKGGLGQTLQKNSPGLNGPVVS